MQHTASDHSPLHCSLEDSRSSSTTRTMASNQLTFLYLSEPDVLKVGLTLAETVQLCTQSFTEHGLKEVDNPPKVAVHPEPDAFLHAMPAWLKRLNQTGLKWVTGFPKNMQKRVPTIAGLVVLNDIETGFPKAVMDGTYITAIRTAAVSGVSVKHLAPKQAKVLAIVGTGVQGKYHALCITNAIPSIEAIRIYDKYEPSTKSFMDQVGPVLGDKIPITVCGSAEEAFAGADIVVTATAKVLEPIFFDKWVKPGALVLPIHTGGWNPEILTNMDKVVVDDWDQFCTFTKKIYNPLPQPFAELGEIAAGKKPGRENDQERIINFNVGLAIHDIVVGHKILEKAKAMGLGQELVFMDLSSPIGLPPIA